MRTRSLAALAVLLICCPALGDERAPAVLDRGVLRLRAPELGAGAIERVAVVDRDGRMNDVSLEAVTRLEDGWLTVSPPPGLDSGTLLVFSGGVLHRFPFQTARAAPRPLAQWDAATRSACLAIAGYWAGTLRGNDPNVSATVSIELDGDCRAVHGILNWRSATSGSNDRVFAGTWDRQARTLTAADVAVNQPAPQGGWRFCRIDRYDLSLSADGALLSGSYSSKACRDRAKVELRRPEAQR